MSDLIVIIKDKYKVVDLDTILPFVRRPSRYIGHEIHSVQKDWHQVDLRMVLVFPDLYEIGMSHQGLQILYQAVNSKENFLAERGFVPDVDLEKLLRQREESLFSLESKRPLNEFDIVGITLPYELCYSNILTVFDLACIPFRAESRDNSHPIIIGGGSCSLNPEPVADFFDAIFLGDGEEAVLEFAEQVRMGKKHGLLRVDILKRLAAIKGVYIPSFFQPEYDNGKLLKIQPLQKGYERIKRCIIKDLDAAVTPSPALVPLSKTIHDRLGIEIARGCTRGCRFCQAGIIYRPVRERSLNNIFDLAKDGISAGGFDELALLSLSTGDYSCLHELLLKLMNYFYQSKVSVAMPSMRVGTLTPEIMTQIQRVRKTGFTVAPEAGSERLRQVINKGISEEDLLDTCQTAFNLGWNLIKFYFMIGLPTETEEDIKAIGTLVQKSLQKAVRQRCNINISASIFVPKPHTPFQWEPQISIEESYRRIEFLKNSLPRKGVKLKWHDPHQSFLEGVFSRGDRRLAEVVEKAWELGARLDGWSEHFHLDTWLTAAERCGVDLSTYLKRREFSDVLPWEHLDSGVDLDFLKAEYSNALIQKYTPDCRTQGCQQCGVCDFNSIKPVVKECEEQCHPEKVTIDDKTVLSAENSDLPKYHYRCTYTRIGDVRFLSHLELLQIIFRALKRARIAVNFSQGFNPSPKVSFSPALPVGTESMAEFFIMECGDSINNLSDVRDELNKQLPDGLHITNISETGKIAPPAYIFVEYEISLGNFSKLRELKQLTAELDKFMEQSSFVISRERKRKKIDIDVRRLVQKLFFDSKGIIHLVMKIETGSAGCKPLELLQAVLDLSKDEVLAARVMKRQWSEEN